MAVTTVELTAEDIRQANALAVGTHEKWKNYRGNYPNKLSTHRTGKLAEIAVERWAAGLGVRVDPVFRYLDRDNEADIVLNFVRVEVKSWSEQNWITMGRCIRPNQLPKIQAKADAILWTVLEERFDRTSVKLAGWSTTDDVAATTLVVTGPPHLRLENHQVDLARMRPLEDLVALVVLT